MNMGKLLARKSGVSPEGASEYFNGDDIQEGRQGAPLTNPPGGLEEIADIAVHQNSTAYISIKKTDTRGEGWPEPMWARVAKRQFQSTRAKAFSWSIIKELVKSCIAEHR